MHCMTPVTQNFPTKKQASRLACLILIVHLFCSLTVTNSLATDSTINNTWLSAHNTYRKIHGVAPLTWSDTLAKSARQFASTCPSGHSGSGFGENIAWTTNTRTPKAIIKMWYGEESAYSYDNPGYLHNTGHFTQIVWKGTKEVGCAQVKNCSAHWPNMEYCTVCQYNPPGNVLGRFSENVFVPL